MRTIWIGACFAALAAVLMAGTAYGAAVMSIDLGSEWLKVGVVAPGISMEIALNKESKRKTPAVIAFRDGNRIFGEDAQTIGLRFPDKSFGYVTDLLGKRADNPIVQLYRERFPYHRIEADESGQTIVFRAGGDGASDDSATFTVEEIVAQFIQKAREQAEASTGQTVTECVLIVPGFFGQAERRALLAAASLANIKVLQLINDYTAVALNYGIFARKEFNESAPQYYMFYDMGASKTAAAVVSYQLVKDKATRETSPVMQVLGVGYDRTLGGLEMQLRLRDHLAAEFNALGKTKTDVRTNARAMAKLFKEAGRVKNVLSANANHNAQIEGLLEEIDFKVLVTRERFEELCADLFERVAAPLHAALGAAGLPLDVVRQVILFGGGTRVPKVQEHLRAAIKPHELGKNINMDEAAAMGAVYRAADLSTGFKVKKFVTKDAALLPLHVTFEREGESGTVRQVKRSLFASMNPYPQKKVITFSKHTEDFEFGVQYADVEHLGAAEVAALGELALARVRLTEVAAALAKETAETEERAESKGIKAHFVLDESGVLEMSGVELVLEKTVAEEPEPESPLSKLGSTISKLFSSEKGADGDGDGDERVQDEETAEKTAEKASDAEGVAEKSDDDPAAAGSAKTDEADASSATNQTASVASNETANAEAAAATPRSKLVTVKHPIPNTVELLFAPSLEGDRLAAVRAKIDEIAEREQRTVRRETALNALETYVIDANQRLDETEYAECATAAEADAVRTACAEVSDWLYEDGETADAETYERRLKDLQRLTSDVYARHWEHNERPDAIKTLQGMLTSAREFHANGKNFTKEANADRDVFTPVELETLGKTITEAEDWLAEQLAAQAKLKRSDAVRLTVKSLTERMSKVDREVKYLVNKLKIWKPKVVKPPAAKKEKKKGDKKATKAAGDSEEKPIVEEPVEEAVIEEPVLGAASGEAEEIVTPSAAADDEKHSEL